jgi:ribose transport system ATP-binding protein
VALVRCTLDEPAAVFLDEPSSALDGEGYQTLKRVVRSLQEAGVAVVYVSHKLEEVMELGDRVTVMRDGCTRATVEVAGTTERELVRYMVGRELGSIFPDRPPPSWGPALLEVRHLVAPGVADVSLTARRGEILGIGGLVGAGRTELAKAIAGLAPVHGGQVVLDGKPVRISSRADALRQGIEYMTEDRIGEGLVPLASLADNMAARVMGRFKRGPFVDRRAQERFAREQIARLSIAARDGRVPVGVLSGGNQQKVLLAACLASTPRVIFFDEPTRGIDVGAKREIYATIRALSKDAAVIVISAELLELLGLSDRIIVMREGRVADELSAAEATEQRIVEAMLGSAAGVGAGPDAV